MVPEPKKKNSEQNKWAVASVMESLSQAAYQLAEADSPDEE
jgi:hypothetical protein